MHYGYAQWHTFCMTCMTWWRSVLRVHGIMEESGMHASLVTGNPCIAPHCGLPFDYVPCEEPLETPLRNTLKTR